MKKKFQSALFSPLGRWAGNNFSFKGGLRSVMFSFAGFGMCRSSLVVFVNVFFTFRPTVFDVVP